MDSVSPIATRSAGEPTHPAGDRFTFAMWNTFKQESKLRGQHLGFRPFQTAREADSGDGRCRGAHYPSAQGYGQSA